MPNLSQKDMEARMKLFNHFALDDQRNYYSKTVDTYRQSTGSVNRIRAALAFGTGFSAALAGLIAQFYYTGGKVCHVDQASPATYCGELSVFVLLLAVLAVVLPTLGAIFGTLADLYQWDRLISIYDTALENLEVADANSPLPQMKGIEYKASLRAFAEGALMVMSDETAQWGQSIRTPESLEKYVKEEKEKAKKFGGDANPDDKP
jgi:hypothetical protein